MKILLLGNTGQLGWELHRTLTPLGEVTALDYPAVDLADEGATRALLRRLAPRLIVNAGAYTAVDRAESEPQLALAVNAGGPRLLAQEARSLGAALIHYSTDYVFDGAKGAPYTEEDTPNPLGAYGRGKLAGERAVTEAGGACIILRTAWVYGTRGDGFVGKVLQWARRQPALKVVTDQVSNPTWARMLAEATAQMLAMARGDVVEWVAARSGLYHLAGGGWCSRLEWAREILRLDPRRDEQTAREVLPALTTDFPTPAQRPLFSALDCARFANTFGLRLPPWDAALRLALGD